TNNPATSETYPLSLHDALPIWSVYEVAATWLAAGLDPNETLIYRQSDVPEVFELNWIISCVTPKGLLNRAHAYKAAVDANEAARSEEHTSELQSRENLVCRLLL